WRDEIYDHYGEDAEEELDCVPKRSGGAYLPRELIESRMVLERSDCPVLQLTLGEGDRARVKEFIDSQLMPALKKCEPSQEHYIGGDFGRTANLTVFTVLAVEPDLKRRQRLTVELENVPW